MKVNLEFTPLDNRLSNKDFPMLIAGPCSAESEEQMITTAKELMSGSLAGKISAFRAGIWKPRTRPGMFEGIGEIGLEWMKTVKAETGLALATEVGNAHHAELCLKAGIDILWIGARTTVNPFTVQEIADVLKGTDATVLVKNPVNPDLELWIGALERLYTVGLRKIGAIHRGFTPFYKSQFRNDPAWNLPLELSTRFPDLTIICDPSHITGKREYISHVSQEALNLGMNGLMIESHCNPACALSDVAQQLTPADLTQLISDLYLRKNAKTVGNHPFINDLRVEIDRLDNEIIERFVERIQVVEKIGRYKKENNIPIFQRERWQQILDTAVPKGVQQGLSEQFMVKFLRLLHDESVRIQNEL